MFRRTDSQATFDSLKVPLLPKKIARLEKNYRAGGSRRKALPVLPANEETLRSVRTATVPRTFQCDRRIRKWRRSRPPRCADEGDFILHDFTFSSDGRRIERRPMAREPVEQGECEQSARRRYAHMDANRCTQCSWPGRCPAGGNDGVTTVTLRGSLSEGATSARRRPYSPALASEQRTTAPPHAFTSRHKNLPAARANRGSYEGINGCVRAWSPSTRTRTPHRMRDAGPVFVSAVPERA